MIAAQGRHQGEPKKGDNSRSAWLFDFTCNSIRQGLDHETILGVITDPTWQISESVFTFRKSTP